MKNVETCLLVATHRRNVWKLMQKWTEHLSLKRFYIQNFEETTILLLDSCTDQSEKTNLNDSIEEQIVFRIKHIPDWLQNTAKLQTSNSFDSKKSCQGYHWALQRSVFGKLVRIETKKPGLYHRVLFCCLQSNIKSNLLINLAIYIAKSRIQPRKFLVSQCHHGRLALMRYTYCAKFLCFDFRLKKTNFIITV